LYEHGARAIDHSLRVGAHGLPLMGSGDWNDGMNRVGIEGRGESVWLGWFLCRLVADFAPLARSRGEQGRAALGTGQRGLGHRAGGLGLGWRLVSAGLFRQRQPLGAAANPEAAST
jgi:cyclic beta-1,2-glucan synthetase